MRSTHRTAAAANAAQVTTNQWGYADRDPNMPKSGIGRPSTQNELPSPSLDLQLGPGMERSPVNSKPQLLAWLLCDAVHIDPSSGKHTILGVFSNIMAKHFPVVHPRMVWFLTITDVSAGAHRMKISMGRELDDPKPLIERVFESQGPLVRINLINEIHNLSFSEPGDYSILIEIDDEALLATSLTVAPSPQ